MHRYFNRSHDITVYIAENWVDDNDDHMRVVESALRSAGIEYRAIFMHGRHLFVDLGYETVRFHYSKITTGQ